MMSEKPTYEELEQRIQAFEIAEFERKRTEETLKQGALKYQILVEGLPDLIYSYSPRRGGMFYSSQVQSVLGYSPSYLLQNPKLWHDSIHPEDLNKVDTAIKEFTEGKPFELEYRIRDANGNWLWLLDRSIGTTLDTGEIIIEGIATDITERKLVEDALRKSRKMLVRTESIAHIGSWEWEIATDTVTWSEELFRIFQIDPDDGAPSWAEHPKLYHPEDFETLRQAVEEAVTDGKPYEMELRAFRKDGEIRVLKARGFAELGSNGKPVRLFGLVHDITDRKQAEETIFQSEKLIRSIVDASQDIILFKDTDLVFRLVNPALCRLVGKTVDEIIGKTDFDIFPPDQAKKYRAVDQRVIETRQPVMLEEEVNGLDGVRWLNTVKSAVLDNNGKSQGVVITARDMTERKRMEEELLRAQKLESVGLLAGGIAHDFNNILTTVIGNIAMARMQAKPGDEIFELLKEAETALTGAQALTKQLLTFAKGGMPVKEIASIKEIIKESSSFVLRGSKSRCEFSIAEDLWPAEVDVGQISQAINNIVINANQAMPEGGIIQISAENLIIDDGHGPSLKPGRYVRVSIRDQGVGIAEKHLLNIFDPYFSTKQEGSGLGLATTFSIIAKHDGHITVESLLGVGTTFHIYLPASDKAVPEKEEVKSIKGRGRILVMDDEASLRKIIGRMLEKLGYEPEFSKDGAEAIDKYKQAVASGKTYDAVIMDMTIPGGMGGKEAVNKLLEMDPEVKAIVSSGYSDDQVLANFEEYGFRGMLPKPYNSHSLSKVLHEVIKGEKE